MSDLPVLYAVDQASQGAVALITLNRPQSLNSFNAEMHHSLWAALDQAEADARVRAIVLTGAGRGFCAGADLSGFDFTPGEDRVARADPGPVIEKTFNPTARRMQALRMPVVAAINGVAAGAGMSLAMSCDMAVASSTASFIQAFSKIGLIPDAGSTWLLPRRVGLTRALGLALTGDKLSAAQALEWGLVWGVSDDCLGDAMSLARRLAAMPTAALVATRTLLREGENRDFEAQLLAEREAQSAMGRTHDYFEGVEAFLAKRAPAFRGN
jgi:2-(1,2-epoxy-1,2-dihydrophenyl)acetyl-CoA isomerase